MTAMAVPTVVLVEFRIANASIACWGDRCGKWSHGKVAEVADS